MMSVHEEFRQASKELRALAGKYDGLISTLINGQAFVLETLAAKAEEARQEELEMDLLHEQTQREWQAQYDERVKREQYESSFDRD